MTPPIRSPPRAALVLASLAACGGASEMIPGTQVPRTTENEAIIERVEAYRQAVEREDGGALLLMAAASYWDDAGTPSGEDDYGRDGLKRILASRFAQIEQIRYAVRYVRIRRQADRAFVDLFIDASYSIKDSRGQVVRQDMRDQNQVVLRWSGETWEFLSGM